MDIPQILISLFVVLFAITVHEASHGYAAYKLGDPTAHSLGRITLNPIAHIDPIGTILLPVILVIMNLPPFGWAKPVPVNPLNFKNYKRDNLIVSAAGPLSNLTVAFVAFIVLIPFKEYLFYSQISLLSGLALILYYTILINIILAVFNLIPIPPLDGSGIIMGVLSDEATQKYEQIRPYGFFILIILLMTGLIGRIFHVIIRIINALIF